VPDCSVTVRRQGLLSKVLWKLSNQAVYVAAHALALTFIAGLS